MQLSDQDFLKLQCLNLENSYAHELACIKDLNNNIIFGTNHFAQEFGFKTNAQINNKNLTEIGIPIEIANEILSQEKTLLTSQNPLNAIHIHKQQDKILIYAVRNRCIKNPFTNNNIGILTNMESFLPGYFRKVYLQIIKQKFRDPHNNNIHLSKLQNEIMFCLLLGFSSRKEIASILSIFSDEYNENRVKNALQAMYDKFDCNSPSALLNNVLLNGTDINIPESILVPGFYSIQ